MNKTEEALESLIIAIEDSGYTTKEVNIGIDVAASSFYNIKTDNYCVDNKKLTKDELHDYYKKLVTSYPISSIEDPFHENEFESF